MDLVLEELDEESLRRLLELTLVMGGAVLLDFDLEKNRSEDEFTRTLYGGGRSFGLASVAFFPFGLGLGLILASAAEEDGLGKWGRGWLR